ncbi:hypothetical protein [Acanthopleuribacter pedis]|uniref:Uncharacterized protein n=1 Tax=Acanthopleuribacter pedis TaxID=442870 RepID=A0A8J7U3X9_9BACT|nr:hypothetical protein [Acanthopleuribacter pedis]MBO1317751.1 hypothetical protein [Acanthopleuribacter pedis]
MLHREGWTVVLVHNHGEVIIPWKTWLEEGPGERSLLTPSRILDSAGNPRPLRMLPLPYRNTRLSRWLIHCKLIRNPWPARPGLS